MVYRKAYTMPIPAGAEVSEEDGRRIARWRLRNGKSRSAEIVDCKDGRIRVRGQSRNYMARYRNGQGDVVEVATGCRDLVAARAKLSQLERQAELIRAGVMTAAEGDAAEHVHQPLSKHLDAYEKHLRAKGSNARRISMVHRRIERIAADCRFTRINRLSAEPVERWLLEQADSGMAAATRNSYRESVVCFGNWCRRTHRLTENPFRDLPRADQNADRRHQRRALTEDELVRLLHIARFRPLAEYGRETIANSDDQTRNPKSRATWTRRLLTIDNIDEAVERARSAMSDNPDLMDELIRKGKERYLIYKTLVLTGLRKGELASITLGQFEIDASHAYLILYAKDEKNRQGSTIPLRADLASELADWIKEFLASRQSEARRRRAAIPASIPPSEPLLNVPDGLTRIFDRDLAAAGIPKRDARNRVVDVHALRVTFCSHLCAAGVPLRTAQAAMRHSKPELTANIYTDPHLLDIAGAINALPALTLPQGDTLAPGDDESIPLRATS